MIKNSRFAKVAVSAGLIVASGAAVLGITSFASAELAADRGAQVEVTDTIAPDSAVDQDGARSADGGRIVGGVAAESADANSDSTTEATSRPPRFDRLSVIAKALGVTESDLVAQLKAGKSIADVAKDKNVDLDTVIAALTDAFKAHLDEEVASGEITQEVADAKLVLFKYRHTEMMNATGMLDRPRGEGRGKGHGGRHGEGHGGRHGEGRGHGPRFVSENLAKVLTLTVDELKTELRGGSSLADIAKAQGVDIADVKDVLIADFKAHLDEEVKNGEHTQEEADAKLAEFTTRLDDMVNGVRPERDGR